MSRTYRKVLPDKIRGTAASPGQAGSAAARDGRITLRTLIRRDERTAGLKEHRSYRRHARVSLRSGEHGTVSSGKMRRYGHRYGEYQF